MDQLGRGDFRSSSVTSLFRQNSLNELLATALGPRHVAEPDHALAELQVEAVRRCVSPIRVDFFSASYVETNSQMLPENIQCALWNLPSDIISNYETVAEHDIMASKVYENPGRAILHSDIVAHEEWIRHPFFRLHCQKYGIYGALMINLRCPGKEHTHITFEYLAGVGNRSLDIADRMMVELVSLPFAYTWLYRFGAIDRPVIERTFELLADLTSTKLTLLRMFVSSPNLDLAAQAKNLGLSPAAYKLSLYQLRDELSPRLVPSAGAKEKVTLRQLDHAYSFLKILAGPNKRNSPVT